MSPSPGELRFDDRVAIVTGGGRGLGREYALALAARGARVVVNDLGAALDGAGSDPGPAAAVAQEIGDAGGEAIANSASVTTPEGAASIVSDALERFGRVDIVINNAGNMDPGGLPELPLEMVQRHLEHPRAGRLQRHARRVADADRARLWPGGADRFDRPLRRLVPDLLLDRQGRHRVARPLAGRRRRRARDRGQHDRARGRDPDGHRPRLPRQVRAAAAGPRRPGGPGARARPGGADGARPRPRVVPGQRRGDVGRASADSRASSSARPRASSTRT